MNPNIELIDRYLSGNMDIAEREAFEKELDQNAELQQQLEQIKQLRKGIQHKALKDLVNKGFNSFKLWNIIKMVTLISVATITVAIGVYEFGILQKTK